jgi:hypothetical protein
MGKQQTAGTDRYVRPEQDSRRGHRGVGDAGLALVAKPPDNCPRYQERGSVLGKLENAGGRSVLKGQESRATVPLRKTLRVYDKRWWHCHLALPPLPM